jgi:hypothetical protein
MFYLPETNVVRKRKWRKGAVACFKIPFKHYGVKTEKILHKVPVRVAAFKEPE